VELTANFDAVILCTGATRPRDLSVAGRDLDGIHFATSYLAAANRRLYGHANGSSALTAGGRDVIVIGGGDTGTDCVATALRQGCRSLTQFEILPRPPAQRAPDNPWPQWPRVFEAAYGHVEAAARFGQDPRRFCTSATAFTGDAGRVAQVHTVDVTWKPGNNGNRRPSLQPVPGSERIWPAQLVLLALGFLGPETPLLQQLGVSQDERSTIATPADPYATNVPGVFAAGDARRGQSLVVWAIHEGRGAARACDRYLMGVTDLP
jgi:glutamate synthase (NADPH/NADH) small chain